MKLRNDFPTKVRLLYLDWYKCFLCGSNGWERGGLEIHHIVGRASRSAFNSSCLCGECHRHIGHTQQEHAEIFFQTIQFLKQARYTPTEEDWQFLEEYYSELVGENAESILSAL